MSLTTIAIQNKQRLNPDIAPITPPNYTNYQKRVLASKKFKTVVDVLSPYTINVPIPKCHYPPPHPELDPTTSLVFEVEEVLPFEIAPVLIQTPTNDTTDTGLVETNDSSCPAITSDESIMSYECNEKEISNKKDLMDRTISIRRSDGSIDEWVYPAEVDEQPWLL